MKNKAFRLLPALIITAAGLYLLFSLLSAVQARPVGIPGAYLTGEFLYKSFNITALYLPVYFMMCAVLIAADYLKPRVFAVLIFSIPAFLTLALLVRVLDYSDSAPAIDYMLRNFGLRGSSLILGLLFLAEILAMILILSFGRPVKRRAFVRKKTTDPEHISTEAVRATAPLSLKNDADEIAELISAADDDEDGDDDEYVLPEAEVETETDNEYVLPDADEEFVLPEIEAEIKTEAKAGLAVDAASEDTSESEEDSSFVSVAGGEWDLQEDDDILNHPDFAESVEPLDLDPDLASFDETAAVSESDKEEKFSSNPDIPLRGDEAEIEQAAKAVWAEAEMLGFIEDSYEPETRKIPDADEFDEYDFDAEDADPRLEVSSGVIELEIEGAEERDEMLSELDGIDELEEFYDEEDDIEDDEDDIEDDDIDIDFELEDVSDDMAQDDEVKAESAGPAVVESVQPEVSEPQVKAAPARKKTRRKKYSVPIDELLESPEDDNYWVVDEDTKAASEVLKETLKEFRIAAEVTGISKGPVITMFEILPAPGVKLSKIVNLADNIALRLAASRVRIVAPIPGKHAVGIEVPNKRRAIVTFKEILEAEDLRKSKMSIPVVLGKDITGGARIIDLVQTPHMLIAGATGSGKSVSVNSLICSILYSRKPEEVKLILIDPKIVELKLYNDIPHLLTPVITEPKKAFQALQYCICEMERRYSLLDSLGVRDIKSFNRKVVNAKLTTEPLPYIVIIVDEFADLMATTGKELENVISRLAAMSRAVGIHLVLATQRPSVDVITGLIKANIPSRIAFMVASKTDSRIILDTIGADKLLGKGDMLFTSAWDPNPSRIQGSFLSEEEVERVTDHVKTLGEPEYIDDEIFIPEDDGSEFMLENAGAGDPLMESAVTIVVEAGKASASYLQRRLKIGYNRAARLVEEMEARGIVGPANGSKPREIMHIPDRV